MDSDPYRVLGLHHGAKREEIKRAFREKALLCHPDRPGGSEAQFRALNEAYQALLSGGHRRGKGNSWTREASYANRYNNYASAESFRGTSSSKGSGPRTRGHRDRAKGYGASFGMRNHWKVFVSSGSASVTAALAGTALVALLMMEPIMEFFWQRQNDGKLFHHLEKDVLSRRSAEAVSSHHVRMMAKSDSRGFASSGMVGRDGSVESKDGTVEKRSETPHRNPIDFQNEISSNDVRE